ncbi:MAG: ATP-binding protein [gamma proteobacterium symbiont of Bathyaustriella thionipta]|nr:ATP-binding protein [gamma proteobacterium symbiont of Bathyaustriella thionipta]
MYRRHFGLTHCPLSKQTKTLWDDGILDALNQRFNWLLESPGVGLLTGEPGVGKTAWVRQLTQALNPHRYQVIYLAETDFGRLDIYRQLALEFGLEPAYRRANLWRQIKEHIVQMVETKSILPVWIIDESHNLPVEFFKDFPAFLNFAFDSKDLMTVWFLGHSQLETILNRAPYAALSSRIQMKEKLEPVFEQARFSQLIEQGFKDAGATQQLISDPGIELLRMASKGKPRIASQLIQNALQLATEKKINHLPDDVILEAIEIFK